MVKQQFLSRLAFCASLFAFGVIALGAFTRLVDAGLGCPDWPGCYGHMIVPTSQIAKKFLQAHYLNSQLVSYKAWAEMIHRYFVGGLSVLIMAILFMIFSNRTLRIRSNIILAAGLIILLAYQIMLGQWTVTLKLLPVIVSQHLLGGYFILGLLWLVYLNNSLIEQNNKPKKIIFWGAILGLILLLGQIILGAWTSTNYASLSCINFPFCLNDKVMEWDFKAAFNIFSPTGLNYEGGVLSTVARQTIHMTHRLGALILTTYFVLFIMASSVYLKKQPKLLKYIYLILGLLLVQLCLGVSNVIFKLPLWVAMSHTLVAALLLLTLITFIFRVSKT